MKIVIKIFLSILLVLNFSGCNLYIRNNEKANYIEIGKIDLNMEYEILSLNDNITGIAMFDECGRPDIPNTNTVIGAHSGNADYAYFNEIYLLNKNDIIKVIYRNKKYIYIVDNVQEIKETDIDVLNDTGKSKLTLLTCKIGDVSKRIIVTAYLI